MASQPLPMTAHKLNNSKGWPDTGALDASHKISATVLYDLVAGQCCQQNAAGELIPGCVGWAMPFFIFGGAASLDVMNTPGINWWPISPRGRVLCFPGKANLQMWTTEFDTTQAYLPNQPLRAPAGLAANQDGISGRLTNQGILTWADFTAPATNKPTAVVGLTTLPTNPPQAAGVTPSTTPVCTNVEGFQCLAFYPVWHPGHPTE